MPVDGKYGYVTLERGTVGDDEPVFVFRAQDVLLPQVLNYYLSACMHAGSPVAHLQNIERSRDDIEAWQKVNPVQIPQSKDVSHG